MNTTCLPLLVVATLLLGCPTTSPADDDDTTADPTPDPAWDPARQAFAEELADFDAPSAALGVMVNGEIVFAEGFGEREDGEAADGETLYRIGSCTKMLTAMALLQQQEAGALDVATTTVAEAVPELADGGLSDWAAQATVANLLSHTSALFDFLEIDGDTRPQAIRDFVVAMEDAPIPTWAPPGRFYNYSNTGFFVAGAAIEEATGRDYTDVMEDDVFLPIGMGRTFFLPEDVLADGNYAVGRGWDWTGESAGQVEVEPDSYDNGWGRPAGYAWSSVSDLLRFANFLLVGDPAVPGNALRGAIHTAATSTQEIGDHVSYGYGMLLTDILGLDDGWRSVTLWSHGGAIPGYAAELHIFPEHGVAIATLAAGDGAYFRTMLPAVLSAAGVDLGGPIADPVPPPDPATDPEIAGDWDDVYSIGATTLADSAGGVSVVAPALDAAGVDYGEEMAAIARDNYRWEVQGQGQGMTVIRDEQGVPEFLRFRFSVSHRPGDVARGSAGAMRDVPAALRWQAAQDARWQRP
jgi:CubicO group peptidase (beta-lactamase class C family)